MNRSVNSFNPCSPAKEKGFSLVEMAIVTVIIGLILGGLLIPLSSQIEKRDRDETRQTLKEIEKALIGYAITNGRLPCPDTNSPPDGAENRSSTCTRAEGILPWRDLGLGQSDAWNQPFLYRVTRNFADNTDGTGCSTPTSGISFELCSNGDIQILDARGGSAIAQNIPAIVISHGKNWAFANSPTNDPDEFENGNNNRTFVDHSYSSRNGNEFDDLVIWISPFLLKNAMLNSQKLP